MKFASPLPYTIRFIFRCTGKLDLTSEDCQRSSTSKCLNIDVFTPVDCPVQLCTKICSAIWCELLELPLELGCRGVCFARLGMKT